MAEKKKEGMKMQWAVIWTVLIIGAIVVWGGVNNNSSVTRENIVQQLAPSAPEPSTYETNFTVGQKWTGVSIPRGWGVISTNLSAAAPIKIRINGDPNRVYDYGQPINYGDDQELQEWMVVATPGRPFRQVQMRCTFAKLQ